jgi:hypothetical protein
MGNSDSLPEKNNSDDIFLYVPDINDFRDKYIHFDQILDYSDIIDLRGSFPPVVNIGKWNGSISTSLSAIIYYELLKLNNNIFIPSRQFIHYNSLLYSSRNQDCISYITPSIRYTLKSIAKWGFCPEQYLPFDLENILEKPNKNVYRIANSYGIEYYRVSSNLNDIKLVLNNKKPIVSSIPLYSSFKEHNVRVTGRIPYPEETDINIGALGIVILGYIEEKELFIVRFPFGDLWGDHGYGYLSYKYIIEMAMDLWIINVITKDKIENYNINDVPDDKELSSSKKSIPIQGRYI